ncbi:MAG: YCF48-related protein [Firmicutes bacterium]|nr:YCF48-related protein [Bacillota bacterium]
MTTRKNVISVLSLTALCAVLTTMTGGLAQAAATNVHPSLGRPVTMKLQTAPSPTLQAVAFATAQKGWLSANGLILGTSDGGSQFHVQYRQAGASFTDIQPVGKGVVAAWSSSNIALTTSDGASWHAVAAPPGVSRSSQRAIEGLQFISAQTAFAIVGVPYQSPDPSVYVTHDAGAKWSLLSGTPSDTLAIGFANLQDGFLITGGNHGGFERTTDGGLHWTRTTGSLPSWGQMEGAHLFVLGPHLAYAQLIGQAGMSQSSSSLFRTVNGTVWTPVLGVPTAGGGPAPGIGSYLYKGTVSNILQTAGKAKGVPLGPGYDVGPVAVVNAKTVRVAGGMEATGMGAVSLAASNDGGSHWHTYPTLPGVNGNVVYDNLSFVNAAQGWLLMTQSNRQVLLHTVNGGATWRQVYPAPTVWPAMTATLVSANDGFGLGVVGNVNAVLRTQNGGHTWSQIANLPGGTAHPYYGPSFQPSLSFANMRDGLAIGADGRVYATNDGGLQWRPLRLPVSAGAATSVYMHSASASVVQTAHGIWITHDAGRNWVSDTANSPAAYLTALSQIGTGIQPDDIALLGRNAAPSIAGVHDQTIWINGASGYSGFMLSQDGGRHFTPNKWNENTNISIANMGFTSAQDGFIWTLSGRLFRTQNGGRLWTQVQ